MSDKNTTNLNINFDDTGLSELVKMIESTIKTKEKIEAELPFSKYYVVDPFNSMSPGSFVNIPEGQYNYGFTIFSKEAIEFLMANGFDNIAIPFDQMPQKFNLFRCKPIDLKPNRIKFTQLLKEIN